MLSKFAHLSTFGIDFLVGGESTFIGVESTWGRNDRNSHKHRHKRCPSLHILFLVLVLMYALMLMLESYM